MCGAVQFTVNLVDLRRAVRRLTMRLGDESAIDESFVILRVALKQLTIETVNSSEELSIEVHQAGTVNVPVAVFCALAKTLRYHGRRQVRFSISSGSIGLETGQESSRVENFQNQSEPTQVIFKTGGQA
jgi:hypothetical protein